MTAPRRGRLAAGAVIAAHLLALGAGFLAPYDPVWQERGLPYAPPTPLRWVDAAGEVHLRPFVHPLVAEPGSGFGYREDRSRQVPVRFLVRGEGGGLFGTGWRLLGVEAPGRIHLLGTDGLGRDLLSRLLYGARLSLFAGLVAGGLSVGLGLLLGSVAGTLGGWPDRALMRLGELFLALPWLYLLFGVRAFLPLEVSAGEAFLLVVGLLGIVGWARPARLVRGVALSVRHREFVRAAEACGASRLHLMRRHILPQAWGVAVAQLVLLIPRYILAEVTLSFLGLGAGEPAPSWGNLLAELQDPRALTSFPWLFAPAVALVLVVFSYQRLAATSLARQ